MSTPRVLLVAGCGDVGTRLGLLAAHDGARVVGLRRDPSALPAPIEPLAADLSSGAFEVPDGLDAVALTVAPNARRDAGRDIDRAELYERVYLAGARGLLAALERAGARPRRLLFTSSTGVYGEDAGGAVDEDVPPEPTTDTGRVLLATEELLRASGHPTTVLRLGGIYGPGRTRLVERVLNGEASYGVAPARTTNRIHADDAARAAWHLLRMDAPPELVCGVDEHPATEGEVLEWLAARLDAPAPRPLPGRSPHGAGKRVSCARLLATGFAFRYPTFREGYEQLVAEQGPGPWNR